MQVSMTLANAGIGAGAVISAAAFQILAGEYCFHFLIACFATCLEASHVDLVSTSGSQSWQHMNVAHQYRQ